MDIKALGWHEFFATQFKEFSNGDLIPARVAIEQKQRYVVYCESGEIEAQVTGRFIHEAANISDFPAVGDWVALELIDNGRRGLVRAVLPRRSIFSRKAATSGGNSREGGRTDEQVVAANIDVIFLVCGLDDEYNLRRIERYLTAAYDSGASPVVLLNKSDLHDDAERFVKEVSAISPGLPVHAVSAAGKIGIDRIREYFVPGATGAFLGSSGVGKSTLINCLLGEERLETRAVSGFASRGRHTTTYRQLIILPQGGLVIDTPGMRELQLWSDGGVEHAFDDIERIGQKCRYSDCTHRGEPGCAIAMAIDSGELDAARLDNYRKMLRELVHLEMRKDKKAQRQISKKRGKFYSNHWKNLKKVSRKHRWN